MSAAVAASLSPGLCTVIACLLAQNPADFDWPNDPPRSLKQFAVETDTYLSSLESKGFNGVLLIAERGTILLHKPYGFADRESGRRMTIDTGSCIGSIVKPMVKAALVKLESEGRLSLSDKLGKHFATVPPDKAEITLQLIIDHQAGFPDIVGDDYEPATRDSVVEKTLNSALVAKPGEKFNYSNAGYTLLAAVIEKVSGRPFERYMVDEILSPAGVKRIGYLTPHWENSELAVGYSQGERWGTPLDHPWMEDGPSWNLRGNGGMLSTVEELYRWFDGVLAGRVLTEAATQRYREMMFRSGSLGDRMIGVAGGNGVTEALYVNVDDGRFVFVLFTTVDRLGAVKVSEPVRHRVAALLRQPTE